MILYLLKRMCFIRVNITGQTRFGVNQRRVFVKYEYFTEKCNLIPF